MTEKLEKQKDIKALELGEEVKRSINSQKLFTKIDADEFNPILRREILQPKCFNYTRGLAFISEWLSVIPNSHYQKRGTYDLRKDIKYHENPTSTHELENLTTRLGNRVGREVVPYLPDELMLNCFARVSRWYYPSLSLVSKRFRSLLTSKELYKTRTVLGTTETCLHMVLRPDFSSCASWFILCRRPTRSNLGCFRRPWKNVLVSVPTHKVPLTKRATRTVVGSSIYMIGGHNIDGKPSSRVFVLDCLSHTWHEAPCMRVPRSFPFVTVIDETIYVMKRFLTAPCQNVIEFFDTKTQIWETLSSPGAEIGITGTSAINGNLYLFGDKKNVVYKPKEKKWDVVGSEVRLPGVGPTSCVVDNIKYCYYDSKLSWWDSKGRSWRVLKGFESLRNLVKRNRFVQSVNYNGKIAVFWETDVFAKKKKKIWCAEVTLEKRDSGQEIRGKVSHRDVLLTVPKSSTLPWRSSFEEFIVSTL